MDSDDNNGVLKINLSEKFLAEQLTKKQLKRLKDPVAYGSDLTDSSYRQWIKMRSPCLFLLLVDVQEVDRIFDVVDNAIDDTDLPFRYADIPTLGLPNQAKIDRFYAAQFFYITLTPEELRHPRFHQGRKPAPKHVQEATKSDEEKDKTPHISTQDIRILKPILNYSHPNLVPTFFPPDRNFEEPRQLETPLANLKSFIESPPKSFKELSRSSRADLIVQWIRCLISAVAHLHQTGQAHQSITPANIYLTNTHAIVFQPRAAASATGKARALAREASYDYGAPEQWPSFSSEGRTGFLTALAKKRKPSLASLSCGATECDEHTYTSAELQRVATQPNNSKQTIQGRQKNRATPDDRSAFNDPQKQKLKNSVSFPDGLRSPSARSRKGSLSAYTHRSPQPSVDYKKKRLDLPESPAPTVQSDIFSVCTVIIELLTVLTSICVEEKNLQIETSKGQVLESNKISVELLKTTLIKAGKGNAAYQANLPAVDDWLNGLLQLGAEYWVAKEQKRMARLKNKIFGDGFSLKKHDFNRAAYVSVLGSLVELVQKGIELNPNKRPSAAEALFEVDKVIQNRNLSVNGCCCYEHITTMITTVEFGKPREPTIQNKTSISTPNLPASKFQTPAASNAQASSSTSRLRARASSLTIQTPAPPEAQTSTSASRLRAKASNLTIQTPAASEAQALSSNSKLRARASNLTFQTPAASSAQASASTPRLQEKASNLTIKTSAASEAQASASNSRLRAKASNLTIKTPANSNTQPSASSSRLRTKASSLTIQTPAASNAEFSASASASASATSSRLRAKASNLTIKTSASAMESPPLPALPKAVAAHTPALATQPKAVSAHHPALAAQPKAVSAHHPALATQLKAVPTHPLPAPTHPPPPPPPAPSSEPAASSFASTSTAATPALTSDSARSSTLATTVSPVSPSPRTPRTFKFAIPPASPVTLRGEHARSESIDPWRLSKTDYGPVWHISSPEAADTNKDGNGNGKGKEREHKQESFYPKEQFERGGALRPSPSTSCFQTSSWMLRSPTPPPKDYDYYADIQPLNIRKQKDKLKAKLKGVEEGKFVGFIPGGARGLGIETFTL